MNKIPHALITGASCGIGKAMAIECAKKGLPVILVALPNETLQQTAGFIAEKYQVPVHSLAIDLTEEDACQKVVSWLKSKDLAINILINNAGIGSIGPFESFSPEFYKKQIHLNTIVPTILTRLLLKQLKSFNDAYIMNVASLGGYFHLPDKNVYSATKSFMISFSHSLDNEMRGSGVHVSVLCPGPVNTNERVTAINKEMEGISKRLILSPEEVAHFAIKRMFKKRRVIIPGVLNKTLLTLSRLTPYNLKRKLIANERSVQCSKTLFLKPEEVEKLHQNEQPVMENTN